MAPVLKVKRMKKSVKPNSKAVAKLKPKWEKPRKSISAQPGVTKIKKVNKRSFDPLKANRGVVLLKNIPHGFYEEEMRKYFGQFGLVTRVRLARSERTGRSKGFAYVEFKVPEVAQIAAETMNNYIMFKHMLKTVYIPPDKQTYNFFRKDVTFTTDEDGDTSFSSAKINSINQAIENINRVPTDEEHAERMKRNQKALQKQQKKYGIDLSNVMVSGNNSASDAALPTEVKAKEGKKKATVAKKVEEKKTETKQDDKKIASKKDKKKLAGEVSSDGGESLLKGLLNTTYETDTSDEDFKIDHSFNASVEDSDDAWGQKRFAALLAKKFPERSMNSTFTETSNLEDCSDKWSDSDFIDNFEEHDPPPPIQDEDDSDDYEQEYLAEVAIKRQALKEVASNGTVDVKAKTNLKRKHKDESPSMFSDVLATSSSQSELDIVAKKKKQNATKKKAVPTTSQTSLPKQGPLKVTMKKKNQKPNRFEKLPLNTTTSSSEPESHLPPTKHKKMKLATRVESASKTDNGKQKMKKAKQFLSEESTSSSPIADKTSSEPEIPKQKLNKKKGKLNEGIAKKPENVTVQVEKEKPAAVNLQSKKEKKNKKPAKIEQTNLNPKASASAPGQTEVQKSKIKNQPAKVEQIKLIPKTAATTSTEPKVQKPEKKNKQKPVTAGESTVSKSEPVKVDKKKKKVKPVTSSLISENGFAKKSIKPTTKANSDKLPTKTSAWSTVSETDGEETKKTKGINANLKTIVHKKKTGNVKTLDAKKVKQTPDELLQLITSKDMKQKKQLKSKKKSK